MKKMNIYKYFKSFSWKKKGELKKGNVESIDCYSHFYCITDCSSISTQIINSAIEI